MKQLISLSAALSFLCAASVEAPLRPHTVFVMADDMGCGQTGYPDHPVLATRNLDAMAAKGLPY
mgnify:CR=1 FL=1